MGDGEITITRTEADMVGDRLRLAVFFRWTGPLDDLLSGFFGPKLKMTLTDGAGDTYKPIRLKSSPIQPVPEETYGIIRNFDAYYESNGADKTFEADAVQNAERLKQLEAEIKAGRNPIAWVHVFQLPWGRSSLALIVENPHRRRGQAGTIEVPVGR